MTNMKKLYAALAKTKTLRAHAEACNGAIAKRAGEWIEKTDPIAERLSATDAEALEPGYNAAAAMKLARGRGVLRRLRGGA